MKKTDWLKTLSWMVPVICFVLAGLLVFLQYQRLQTRKKELGDAQALASSLRESISQWTSNEGRDRIPSVANSRVEEATFLDEVRQVAIANGVRLVKWVNEGNDPTVARQAPNAEEEVPPAVRNVRTLASNVEVAGSFVGVRGFVRDLLGSTRLLTIKTGTWERGGDEGETRFSFKLNRFVTPPVSTGASATADVRTAAQG